MTKFSSPLPLKTYRTDGFDGLGKGREHIGVDWAGPNVGDKTPVYAVADGVVSATGGPRKGAVVAGHSGLIVEIDHGVLTDKNGSDHIWTNYGHLSKILVKKGDKVKAGQQIGITGDTGNVTGVHLHFGVKQNGEKFSDYFDGERWLKSKGITVGVTAPLEVEPTVVPLGSTKPAASRPRPVGTPHGKTIQTRLAHMRLYFGDIDGVNGNMQRAAVKKFQKAHYLVQDGVWGKVTEARYDWNVALQKALNAMKGYDIKVDGYVGSGTLRRIKDVTTRNAWGNPSNAGLESRLRSVGAWK